MQRWKEALVWAHGNGLRVLFNLNLLHGRYDNYSAHLREPEWWEGCTHLPYVLTDALTAAVPARPGS